MYKVGIIMYGEENDGIEERIKAREAFFKKHDLECVCHPGYTVCGNCRDYHRLGGRLTMRIEKLVRRIKSLRFYLPW